MAGTPVATTNVSMKGRWAESWKECQPLISFGQQIISGLPLDFSYMGKGQIFILLKQPYYSVTVIHSPCPPNLTDTVVKLTKLIWAEILNL